MIEAIEDIVSWLRDPKVKNPMRKAWRDVLADRIEAAARRELPQPDPDWKSICEKCHDGDIEPECEYFGEPNGCNSPIYGEHPKAKPVGNAAAMCEALKKCRDLAETIWQSEGGEDVSAEIAELKDCLEAALAAPARNCDVGTPKDQLERFSAFCDQFDADCTGCPCDGNACTLGACFATWAQMLFTDHASNVNKASAVDNGENDGK